MSTCDSKEIAMSTLTITLPIRSSTLLKSMIVFPQMEHLVTGWLLFNVKWTK